jgi:hypothetical protein
MNRNNAVDRQFAKLLAPLAILFVSAFQCAAQSQDQAGTAQNATGKDEIIACRFSVLDIYVDVEVKDQRGKVVPNLDWKNFLVYEDGVRQDIYAFMQVGEQPNGKYLLYYLPTNPVFDSKRRKVRIEARTTDGRKLRVSYRLRPDPINEFSFKVDVYPQGYSIQELPRKN